MKLQLDIPVLFTARPRGSRNLRDVYLTSRREYEVPEFSRSECTPAYSSGGMDGELGRLGPKYESFNLLNVRGRLYRKIDRKDVAIRNYFRNPFSTGLRFHFGNQSVETQLENRLRLQHQLGVRDRRTWPPGGEYRRNRTFLENELGSLSEIDPVKYGEAILTASGVASGLILVDDDLWCEVPEPCIAVGVFEWDRKVSKVYIITDFAWNTPEHHYGVTCRRFSLNDHHAAKAYADSLSEMIGDDAPVELPFLEIERHGEREGLNDQYEHSRRICRDLSYACLVTAHRKPMLAESLSYEQTALLDRCRTALLEENNILGQRFEEADDALELLEIWRLLGRPLSREVLHLEGRFTDRYLERTLEDAAPVVVFPRAIDV